MENSNKNVIRCKDFLFIWCHIFFLLKGCRTSQKNENWTFSIVVRVTCWNNLIFDLMLTGKLWRQQPFYFRCLEWATYCSLWNQWTGVPHGWLTGSQMPSVSLHRYVTRYTNIYMHIHTVRHKRDTKKKSELSLEVTFSLRSEILLLLQCMYVLIFN